MTESGLPLVVEPDELQAALDDESILVADVSQAEFHQQSHIPGAVHVDYARIISARPPVMGLLPPAEQLGTLFSSLGLGATTHVVAYDNEGGGRASRLLWTLEITGHTRYSLLNGGFIAWRDEGRPTETQTRGRTARPYTVRFNAEAIADKTYILAHLHDPAVSLVDARSPEEYAGLDLRARRGGHIPGAVNIEWTRALDPQHGMRLKAGEDLRALYEQAGVTPDRQAIVYCQTHHRSALSYIVLTSLGYSVRGYPGSWSEWGNDPDTPVER
ncbi:MAG: sulfurtransferase [Gammaproteobacteria bacterium]